MVYWGPISLSNGIFTTDGLLMNRDGRCGAWSDFFVDTLAIQGVPVLEYRFRIKEVL